MTSNQLTLEEALIYTANNTEIEFDFGPCLSDDRNLIEPNVKAYHLFWPNDPDKFSAMRFDMEPPPSQASYSFFTLYNEFRRLFSNRIFKLWGRINSPVNELEELSSAVADYLQPRNEDWSELEIIYYLDEELKRTIIFGSHFELASSNPTLSQKKDRGGRPPTYDWQRIAIILSEKQAKSGLSFKTKKALNDYISALCEDIWQQSPETRTIRIGLDRAKPGLFVSLIDS